MRFARAMWVTGLFVTFGTPLHAQPSSRNMESAAASDRAAVSFEHGVRAFESANFELALEHFRKSLEIYATPAATKNAALCLRELGRFDEALELLEALPRRFPDLPPEEARQNRLRIDELSSEIGWIELRGLQSSSQLVIDGRDRGGAPTDGRVRLTKGNHHVRVIKEGALPTEIVVAAIPGQTVMAEVDQRPSDVPSNQRWSLGIELGATVTPALGGDVAGCSSPCERSIGAGGRVMVRAGRALGKALSLSIDVGFLALGQDIESRAADVIAVGDVTSPGTASDSLSMSGGLVGLSLAYRLPSLGDSLVRAGAGSFLGSIRDERRGNFATTATSAASYDVGQSQRQAAYYGYLSLAIAIGFRPNPSFRVGAGLDAMAMIALRQPQWDGACGEACRISGGPDGESWFPNDALAGRFMKIGRASCRERV